MIQILKRYNLKKNIIEKICYKIIETEKIKIKLCKNESKEICNKCCILKGNAKLPELFEY